MKKSKNLNFIEWNYKILTLSLKKINLNILIIIILDFLFYILSGYFVIFWIARISEKVSAFNLPADLAAIGIERAQQLSRDTQLFYYLLVFSFIVLLIAIIFLASILKGIIWAKTADARITFRLISKFLGLNMLWLGFWLILVFLISWIVEIKYALAFMAFAVLIGFYLSNNLYSLFMGNPSFKLIKRSIKLSITKIHLFLLPYIVIFIGFYLVVSVSSMAKLDNFSAALAQKIYGFLGFAATNVLSPEFNIALLIGIFANPLLLLFAALVRYYTSTLAAEISSG